MKSLHTRNIRAKRKRNYDRRYEIVKRFTHDYQNGYSKGYLYVHTIFVEGVGLRYWQKEHRFTPTRESKYYGWEGPLRRAGRVVMPHTKSYKRIHNQDRYQRHIKKNARRYL